MFETGVLEDLPILTGGYSVTYLAKFKSNTALASSLYPLDSCVPIPTMFMSRSRKTS